MLRRPAVLCTIALALLAIWEIVTLARASAGAATDADWRAAATIVDREWQPGDLVVFAPAWIDPLGRRWLGHRLTLADLGRMDAATYRRIWEVSIRGADAPEVRDLTRVFATTAGPIRVRRLEQTPVTTTWRAHERGDLLEVAHRPRQCVRVMGRRDFPQVTLGDTLVVYAGLADVWARRDNRAYADVTVSVDGREVATTTIGNRSGWVALPAVATTPGPHDVSVSVRVNPTRGEPKKAKLDVCVAAEGRTTGSAAAGGRP